MNQRGSDDGALAQGQATVAQTAIDHTENASGQLVSFQQATEVEPGGFVRDSLQAEAGKLAQNRVS